MRFFLLLALPLAAGACGGQAFEVASIDAGEDNAPGDGGNPADTGGPNTSPSDATMIPDARDAGVTLCP